MDPYIAKGRMEDGDLYLLCSDGLTDMLDPGQIADLIYASEDPARCAQALLDAALADFTQTDQMDIPQKIENVRDAFSASCDDTGQYRHILIIDDVFTSGSTLGACFRALRDVFPPEVRISVATLGFVGG